MTILRTGMIWRGDKSLSAKANIRAAADHFIKKHGKHPNLCTVNVNSDAPAKIGSIVIRKDAYIQPNEIFIGLKEMAAEK